MNKGTLCIVFFNQADWVEGIVDDALKQKDVKIIFSDDASTDQTYSKLINYLESTISPENSSRITVRRSKSNLGVAKHINSLFPLIDTEFVSFIAGDDRLDGNYFSKLLSYFNDGISCVTSNQYRINSKGKVFDKSRWSEAQIPSLQQVIASESFGIPSSGTLYRTESILKFGPLPDNIINEDDQILFRAIVQGERLVSTEHLFYYRVHEKSLSSWHRKLIQSPVHLLEKARAEEKNRINNILGWIDIIKKSNLSTVETTSSIEFLLAKIELHRKDYDAICRAPAHVISGTIVLLKLYAKLLRNHLSFAVGRALRSLLSFL